MIALRALLLALALIVAGPALAVSPGEMLPDPVLEQRARDLSAGLRCLVCQNQSIDDSDAQVQQYLVDRYGEYVLLNPRVNNHTILLWVAAPTLLALGLGTLFVVSRRRKVVDAGLSVEEQAALDELK